MRSLIFTAALLPAILLSQSNTHTAAELIAGVKGAKPQGGFHARLRMEHRPAGGKPVVMQVQVKKRAAADGTAESLYQLLFPKERKGEGLLLRAKDGSFSGFTITPGQSAQPLKPADRNAGVFGTALSIDDAIAEFLNWSSHEITGKEKLGAVQCAVIESRPSPSAKEKAVVWVDESRLAAMKIEMRSADCKLAKTIVTNKVMRGSTGYYAPVDVTITDHASGAVTEIEGVRSQSGLSYTDADFSEAALKSITLPAGKGEN